MEAATEAIQAVHGDTSVPQHQTADSLRELEGECQQLASLVESEMDPPSDDDDEEEEEL